MANTTRPSVPPSHASESEHRRQIANVVNIINQTTPDYSRTDAEIAAGVTPVDYRYPEGDVRRYGAVGDGTTDDTTAIQAAVKMPRVFVPPGRYKVTTEISITSACEINFAPGAIIDISGMAAGTSLGEKCAFRVEGSEESPVSVDADIAVGDEQVQVSSTSSFSAGDWVCIRSNELYMDGASGVSENRGHITRIKSIDSSTLMTLVERSPFSYTAVENANVRKYNMVDGVEFHGGRILGGGVNSTHNGIIAGYTTGLVVDGMEIDGCEDCGVRVHHSFGATVKNCRISDCTSSPTVGTTGYGVAYVRGTRNSHIINNQFRNCRHAVAGGGEPLSIHVDVVGNHAIDCGIGAYAYDCHEPCFWWRFHGNTAHGGDGGFVLRGQHTIADSNTVRGVDNYAFRIRTFDTNTDGLNDIVIRGNRGFDCGNGFIWLQGVANGQLNNVVIEGNIARNCNGNAIFGERINDLMIIGNDFEGNDITITNLSGDINIHDNFPQSETATGTFTADIYKKVTDFDSSGGAVTATLPDGVFPGQRKMFTMSDASNSSTLSVTTHETGSPAVFTFSQTTDVLILEWTGALWWTVKNIGVAT